MTAHDQMRAMLDQLMGTGRNGENNKFHVKFNDPRVCKSFLLSCCPHEILSSTVFNPEAISAVHLSLFYENLHDYMSVLE